MSLDNILAGAIQLAQAYVRDAAGRHGTGLTTINEAKQVMRVLAGNALAEARREGAEQMRSRAAAIVTRAPLYYGSSGESADDELAQEIEDLPLPTGRRQAVRLTDEQVGVLAADVLDTAESARRAYRIQSSRNPVHEAVRAIETAVLAANGMETK